MRDPVLFRSVEKGLLIMKERSVLAKSGSVNFKMANRTVTDAKSVKGTNPQYLVEKIVRTRIYESKYWKEQCFALSGGFSCQISFYILGQPSLL